MKKIASWMLVVSLLCLGLLRLKIHLESSNKIHPPIAPTIALTETITESKSLKLYNLGFGNLLSGLMWIDLLQRSETSRVEGNKVSWEYGQLEGITSLDPKFERAYSFGSIFLSVFRQDKLGALRIMEKWVKQSPLSWRSNYLLGYHLFYEIGEKEKAAPYLLRAANLEGSPAYLTALGIRLLSEKTGLVQSLRLATDLYQDLRADDAKERLLKRIRSLNFGIQKEKWDTALKNFRQQTGRYPHNIEELRPQLNQAEREVTAVAPSGDVPPEVAATLSERFNFSYDPASKSIVSPQTSLDIQKLGTYQTP